MCVQEDVLTGSAMDLKPRQRVTDLHVALLAQVHFIVPFAYNAQRKLVLGIFLLSCLHLTAVDRTCEDSLA